jgi:hypothetical protein
MIASDTIFPLLIETIPGCRLGDDADPECLANIGQGGGAFGHAFPTMEA